MSLPTKKTPNDFPFKHSGQADAFGDSKGGNVATIQSDFDNRAIFNQDQINAIITALESDAVDASGAHEIGFGSTQGDITSNNVGDALDEIVTIAKDAQAGTILPNSITNDKLGLDNKVGSLALLDTTNKTDSISAINEVNTNTNDNTSDISDINAEGTTIDVSATGDILLTYADRFLNCTNAGAITLTIQPNATIALPLYTEIAFKLKGAGSVVFAEGAGVTIDSVDSALTLATQYATCALHQTELNVWTLSGLLE